MIYETKLHKLELGKEYKIGWRWSDKFIVRLIQPTPKGYNFLVLDKHKCFLRHHIYPSKKFDDNKHFFVSAKLTIEEYNG